MTSQPCCQGIWCKKLVQTGQESLQGSLTVTLSFEKQCCQWITVWKGKLFWKVAIWYWERERGMNRERRWKRTERKFQVESSGLSKSTHENVFYRQIGTLEDRQAETDSEAKTGRRQQEIERGGWRWIADRKISGLFKCCPALVESQSCCQGAVLSATPAQWAFVTLVLRGAQGCSSWPETSQVFSCRGTDNQARCGIVDAGEFWAFFFFTFQNSN